MGNVCETMEEHVLMAAGNHMGDVPDVGAGGAV